MLPRQPVTVSTRLLSSNFRRWVWNPARASSSLHVIGSQMNLSRSANANTELQSSWTSDFFLIAFCCHGNDTITPEESTGAVDCYLLVLLELLHLSLYLRSFQSVLMDLLTILILIPMYSFQTDTTPD